MKDVKYHWPQRKHNGIQKTGKMRVQPCTIELMTAQEFSMHIRLYFAGELAGYVYQSSRFCKSKRAHKATAGTYAMHRHLTGKN